MNVLAAARVLMRFVGILSVAVLAAWAAWLGGDVDWGAGAAFRFSLYGVAGFGFLVCRAGGGTVRRVWDWRWGLPLAGLLALMAVQALNTSHDFLPDSRALVPRAHYRWLPASVDRESTFRALSWLVGFSAVFWAVRVCASSSLLRRGLVGMLVLAGVVMAAQVVLQRRTPPSGALYPLTGTFVNSGNYAVYANVLLALGLAYAVEGWISIRNVAGRVAFTGILGAAALFLLYSLSRSGSRMGVVVSFLAVAAVALYGAVRRGGWVRWVLPAALVAGLLIPVLWRTAQEWSGCEGGWSLRQIQANAVHRFRVQEAVVRMVPDRWAAGFGAGTFEKAFPYYQPRSLSGSYRHAHNEYTEGLVEFGVLGMGLIVCLVWSAFFYPVRDGCWAGLSGWERAGIWVALGVLLMHAMSDFPFTTPVAGVLIAVVTGMSGGQLRGSTERGGSGG